VTFVHRVHRHEAVLLILYSIAPLDVKKRIDAELFDAWTHLPCKIDAAAPETASFRLAVQRLHGQHLVGKPLTQFATFWIDTKGA
jgi:hypothetical protein